MNNPFLDIKDEVKEALAAGKPVLALESTIISHGMPYPENVKTALKVEQIARESGVIPATIAIIGGRLKAGLTTDEIEYFGKKGTAIHKASRRDLPYLTSRGEDGATTVASTMIIAAMAVIPILPLEELEAFTGELKTVLIYRRIFRNWLKQMLPLSVREPNLFWIWVLHWNIWKHMVFRYWDTERLNFLLFIPGKAVIMSIIQCRVLLK